MNRLLILKKVRIGCLAIVLLAVFMGCSEDKKILGGTCWKVTDMKFSENSEMLYLFVSDADIWLVINNYGEFALQSLDDGISGRVKVGNSKINFKEKSTSTDGFCNPFMKVCADLLINKINHYEMSGDNLVLTGKKGEVINLVLIVRL